MIEQEAGLLLQVAIGDSSGGFRVGQWEAIDALVNQRKNYWWCKGRVGKNV